MYYNGELIRVEKEKPVPAPEPETLYIFHEQTTQPRCFYNGMLIKEGSVFCDVMKKGQCIENGIREAERICDHYKVTKDSELVVELHLVVSEEKRRLLPREPHQRPGEDRYQCVQHPVQVKREIIWTSREGRLPTPREVKE